MQNIIVGWMFQSCLSINVLDSYMKLVNAQKKYNYGKIVPKKSHFEVRLVDFKANKLS